VSFKCNKCKLGTQKNSFGVAEELDVVPGDGPVNADVMFIAMNPGAEEQLRGKPLVGPSGAIFNDALTRAGIQRSEVYITNMVKHITPKNRNPYAAETRACRAFLDAEIDQVKPKIIVLMGTFVVEKFLEIKGIEHNHGRAIYREDGTIIVPTHHPANFLPGRSPGKVSLFHRDIKRVRELMDGGQYPDNKVIIVDSKSKLDAMVAEVKDFGSFAWDLETTDLRPCFGLIADLSICATPDRSYVVPILDWNGAEFVAIADDDIVQQAFDLIEDPTVDCTTHGGIFDYKWAIQHDYITIKALKSWVWDTIYAHHACIHEKGAVIGGGGFRLETLCSRYLKIRMWDFGKQRWDFDQGKGKIAWMPYRERAIYAGGDTNGTLQLAKFEQRYVLKNRPELLKLYFNVEHPRAVSYVEMVMRGVKVDRKKLSQLRSKYKKALNRTDKKIYEIFGKEFKINDNTLAKALVDDLRIIVPKNPWFYTKAYKRVSMREEVRNALAEKNASPVWEYITRHKHLAKLLSQYVGLNKDDFSSESLPNNICSRHGRLHTNYLPHGTVTGRSASREPNLQNIPKRNEEGAELRECFIPSDGMRFVLCDYDTAEYWVAAHLSGDPEMLTAFDQGLDIHKWTASLMFNVAYGDVTNSQRDQAKTVGFGTMYGGGANTLARGIGVSVSRAEHFIKTFYDKYPVYKEWQNTQIALAKQNGYVETAYERRRHIDWPWDGTDYQKGAAEREAMNTPIQGTVGGHVARAIPRVQKALKDGEYNGYLLMEVHDELITEVEIERAPEWLEAMLKAMTFPVPGVGKPIPVSGDIRTSWRKIK